MRRLITRILASLAVGLALSPAATAGDLRNFVKDLYGGDGITVVTELRNAPGVPAPSGFEQATIEGLEALSSQLLSTQSFFSLSSARPGFTFDFELGVPVRETESLGPLIAERAETIGKNRLNVAFAYTQVEFKRLDGQDLDDLTILIPSGDFLPQPFGDGRIGPDPPCDPADPLACTSAATPELDLLRLDLDVEIKRNIFAIFAKYGLLENLDVELILPFVQAEVKATSTATIVRSPFNQTLSEQFHQFGPLGDSPYSSTSGSAFGIGDLVLRSKWNFLADRDPWPDLALFYQIEFPTGREEDLLGTGETNFRVLFIASKQFGWITPHLNVGYEFSTGASERDNLRYIAGFDARLNRSLTGAVEVVGVYGPNVKVVGNNLVDAAVGLRWKAWRSLILNANVQVPINRNQGLRPDLIWSLGFDYTFGGE